MRPSIANWKSGVAIAVLYVVALVLAMRRIGVLSIIAALLSCSGCVTAQQVAAQVDQVVAES